MRADLESIQEGDRVILRWVRHARIGKVVRRTPGGRLLVDSQGATYEFNKRGRQMGSAGSWDAPHLELWSEEEGQKIVEDFERSRLVHRFRYDVDWTALPVEILRQIAALTKP